MVDSSTSTKERYHGSIDSVTQEWPNAPFQSMYTIVDRGDKSVSVNFRTLGSQGAEIGMSLDQALDLAEMLQAAVETAKGE